MRSLEFSVAIMLSALVATVATTALAGPTGSGNPIVCNINDDVTQDLAFAGSLSTDRVNTIAAVTTDTILASFPQTGNGVWNLESCDKVGSAGLIAQGDLGGSNQDFVRVLELNSTGATVTGTKFVGRGGGVFTFVGTADYDGDGLKELVLDGEDGTAAQPFAKVEFVYGTNAGAAVFLNTAGGDFLYAGAGDTNGDTMDDLLWVTTDGTVLRIDLSNGVAAPTPVFLSLAGGDFTINGIGDLTGDGKADLAMNAATTAKLVELDGGTILSESFVPNGGGTLIPMFVGDTTGDGSGSVVFVGATTSRVNTCTGASPISCATSGGFNNDGFTPAVLGDFDGDGADDIIGLGQPGAGTQFTLLTGFTVKNKVQGPLDGGGQFSLVE